ncbi:MAG: hypothetical protein V4574_04125 [Pseudomonadota bacterium]
MAFAVGAALSVSACQAQAPDPSGFAREMTTRVKAKLPGSEVIPSATDPLSVTVKGGEMDGATINFHRVYGYCRTAAAADCEASKAEFFDRALKMPPKATAASLRLIVRDEPYMAYVRSLPPAPSGEQVTLVSEPIGDGLHAILASDSPDAVATVAESDLNTMGLDRARAWTLAVDQTQAILPPLPTAAQLGKGAVMFQGQEYLASMIIDRRAWAALAAEIGPDLFVTVVADDTVFVGRMPDGPDLERFRKGVADDCAQQQRCISPHLYRFRDGRWVVPR